MAIREEKKNKLRVGIADAKISRDASEVLVTYSLGSCVGVCLYDATMQIGGMLHCLLPHSAEDPQQAKENPFKYVDTGFTALLDELISMGACKKRLKAKIAGALTAQLAD